MWRTLARALPLALLLGACAAASPASRIDYDAGERVPRNPSSIFIKVEVAPSPYLSGEQARKLAEEAEEGFARALADAGIASGRLDADTPEGALAAWVFLRLRVTHGVHLLALVVPIPTTRNDLLTSVSLWRDTDMVLKASSDGSACRRCDAYIFARQSAEDLARTLVLRMRQ